MKNGIDQSQHKAAKVVGALYLFAMAISIYAEIYVRGTLIVAGDALTTAQNIIAHQQLFRVSIATELVTFASDITLTTALYVILAPVNRHLAMLAAFFRIVAASVCVMMAAHSFDVLRILSGAEYLGVFEPGQLAALARLSIGSHGATYYVGWVFLGFGSTVFGYLWVTSKYVPRALGALGVFASFLLGAGSLVFMTVPSLRATLDPGYMAPMFFFEVGMGIWLLVKGLRPAGTAQLVA